MIYILFIIDSSLDEDWEPIRMYKQSQLQQATDDLDMMRDKRSIHACLRKYDFEGKSYMNMNEFEVIETTLPENN